MVTRQQVLSVLFLFALCSRVLASSPVALATGTGSIAGRVTAQGEGEPLPGVNILLQGTVRGTTTNSRGEYRIQDIPPGRQTLVFSIVGYQRENRSGVVVEEGKETILNVSMTQTPIQTEQIVVTASKRQQSLEEVPVSISVLDATAIDQRNALTIDDALRYIPGVNMTGFQVNIRGSSGYSRGAGSRDPPPGRSRSGGDLTLASL